MKLIERIRSRIEEAVREQLEPSEELRAYTMCTIARWRILVFLLGPLVQAFADRPHYLAITDNRVLLLKPSLGGKKVEVVFRDPRGSVNAVASKDGWLRSWLKLRRATGEELRLEFTSVWKKDLPPIRRMLYAG